MNYKLRAFMVALAVLLCSVPAFAANSVGAGAQAVQPGVATISLDVQADADLRGLGFGYELVNGDAASVAVNAVTVNLAELGSRRIVAVDGTSGNVFLAGRNGDDDLAAGAYPAAIDVEVDIQGVSGNTAQLVICGVDPWPNNQIFVSTDDNPVRILEDCVVIDITVQANVICEVVGACPENTYEGGGVAVQVQGIVNVGTQGATSIRLIGMTKDGQAADPVNMPDTFYVGGEASDGSQMIVDWVTAAGDAGDWEICFEAYNDEGDTDTCCYAVTVGVPGSDHVAWLPQNLAYTDGGGAFGVTLALSATNGIQAQGIVLPFIMSSVAGGAFWAEPVQDPGQAGDGTGDLLFSPAYAGFASKSTNTYGNDAVSPDSMLGGLISFGAALAPQTVNDAMLVSSDMAAVEGIMAIDSAFLPPANQLTFNDPTGAAVFPTYSPGCYPVTIVRNLCPDQIGCPVASVGPIIFGDPVSVPGFTFSDPDGSPGPYTFSVVSATHQDDAARVPTNAPVFVDDEFTWQTSNADENDVGIWEFCVTIDDGAGCAGELTCCFTVEVIAQVPAVCFRFGDIGVDLQAPTNTAVCIPLYIDNIDPCLELGGFDLLFTYDASMLTFTGIDLDGSILEAAGWEYLTYRIVSTNPAKIRIVAIADMNNSNTHPETFCLDGLIANICFRTTSDLSFGCQKGHIRFCWDDCGDNTASSADGNTLYIITDPYGPTPWGGGDPTQGIPGGGIISNSQSIQAQMATFEGGITGPADFPCDFADPNKPAPEQYLYFVNGAIKITCPGDLDDRGDVNLNGLAYEISDAVLFSNYFISGPSVFTINVDGQIAATDVNADGIPLTVADLVYLIRVITGDADPIAGDLLGGGPKVATVVGQIDVLSAQQGSHVAVSTTSDQDMGAGLFVFNYENAEISSVTAVGRASNMDVIYEAADGELRVLVYNIEDRAKIEAGAGEILAIATNGVGNVELVSVEAASFMGGSLEANVSAKIIPTAYALHQNFPNPFNPSTSMAIDFPKAAEYSLTIYNIAGQVVKTYAGNAEAGTLTVTWDGTNNRGSRVASGVYFYAFETDAFTAVKKMVLMK